MSSGFWEGTIESAYFSCEEEFLFLAEIDARDAEDGEQVSLSSCPLTS